MKKIFLWVIGVTGLMFLNGQGTTTNTKAAATPAKQTAPAQQKPAPAKTVDIHYPAPKLNKSLVVHTTPVSK